MCGRAKLIDVACGTGQVRAPAAARVGGSGTVTGIDIAPDMIEVARSVRRRTVRALIGRSPTPQHYRYRMPPQMSCCAKWA